VGGLIIERWRESPAKPWVHMKQRMPAVAHTPRIEPDSKDKRHIFTKMLHSNGNAA
jgi:hypothetical protein